MSERKSAIELDKFNELSSFMKELFFVVSKNLELDELYTLSGDKEYTYKYILENVQYDYNKIMNILSKQSQIEKIIQIKGSDE